MAKFVFALFDGPEMANLVVFAEIKALRVAHSSFDDIGGSRTRDNKDGNRSYLIHLFQKDY